MTHVTRIDPPPSAPTESRVPPHARPVLERARKLEALPLADLAARVAEGLARLRASFGLEARDPDPLRALCASLPRTDLARRATELEAELASARTLVLERERAAADVERRSESLKEALRERSSDLAAALACAEAGVSAQRELESARAALAAAEAERARLARDLERARAESGSGSAAIAELAAARARAEQERAASERTRAALEARLADAGRALAGRLELARGALDAAEARASASRLVADLDKDALLARAVVLAAEVDRLRDAGARDGAQLARLVTELEHETGARRAAESAADAARAATSRDVEALERELAWRRHEMDALREAAGGLAWKLLGGGARERIARWEKGERP